MTPRPPRSTLFPYTTLFRSSSAFSRSEASSPSTRITAQTARIGKRARITARVQRSGTDRDYGFIRIPLPGAAPTLEARSEEHTSELQSQFQLVCRLLLEKKK